MQEILVGVFLEETATILDEFLDLRDLRVPLFLAVSPGLDLMLDVGRDCVTMTIDMSQGIFG